MLDFVEEQGFPFKIGKLVNSSIVICGIFFALLLAHNSIENVNRTSEISAVKNYSLEELSIVGEIEDVHEL